MSPLQAATRAVIITIGVAGLIAADGEYQVATTMAADPGALQLRRPQTVVEVAAEKNSTLVMPFPVELLRFLDRNTSTPTRDAPAAALPALRVTTVPREPTPQPEPVLVG
jgi:hypothetical protein